MKYIHLHPADNTATALADLEEGEILDLPSGPRARSVELRGPIRYAHKFAVSPIPAGADVVKYGEVIGEATRDIAAGEHVHVHNVAGKRARGGS